MTNGPGSAPTMVRLVAVREVRQRLRSRAFLIFTGILCALIIGGGVLSGVLRGNSSTTKYNVGVLGTATQPLADDLSAIARQLDVAISTEAVAARPGGEAVLRSGRLDAVIDASTGEVVSKRKLPDKLAQAIDVAWRSTAARQAATAAGLDRKVIDEVLSPAPLQQVQLEPATSDKGVGTLVGLASAVLLFMSITSFGGYVLMGVVEEKTTGVVEVLLSKVRAHHLLTGKVLGIGAVALIQFAAAVLAGLIALRISGVGVPSAVWIGMPVTVLWFIAGFVLYSTLFALAGSFVSRQEDAQGAAAPISMLFTAAYLAVFTIGFAPRSTASRFMSVLPPFAPLLMPLRMVTGAASVVEILVAAVLLLAAIAAMLRFAGAVYSRTLLHRGTRLRWKQVLRLSRSSDAAG